MKKGVLISIVLLIFVILIVSFRTNWITGAAVVDTTKLIKNNYTSQILDLAQKNIALSLEDKNPELTFEKLRIDAEKDLIEIKKLNERLDSIDPPPEYEEVHSHLKKNYEYLIKSLEIARESAIRKDETKLNLSINYIKRANEEVKLATELLRNI